MATQLNSDGSHLLSSYIMLIEAPLVFGLEVCFGGSAKSLMHACKARVPEPRLDYPLADKISFLMMINGLCDGSDLP